MNWTAEIVARATGGHLVSGSPDQGFDGIGTDSRTIEPGRLFVALQGERFDAHRFLDQVVAGGVRGLVVAASHDLGSRIDDFIARGVACVAVEDTTRALGALAGHQRRQAKIPVVAITGSNGKTTTRRMTARVMGRRYETLATRGNFNNEIGLPLTLFQLTPRHQAAVLELGMNHPGEIDRLGAICKPTIGVITNVGPVHLEFLHDVANVGRAKGELLAHIAPDGHAVLNCDDPLVAGLADRAPCPVTFFGLAAHGHVRAEAVESTAGGVAFDLRLPGETTRVRLQTPARFMVHNALAAAAVGHLAGLGAGEIKAGLEAFTAGSGRLTVVRTPAGLNIIDDTYNANPVSMEAAIETFGRHRPEGGGYVVLGDMLELGAAADELHRSVGRCVGRVRPAMLYAYGPYGPRVAAGAADRGMTADTLFVGEKEDIVRDLVSRLQPGDWILVKGSRGMAMETVVQALSAWQRAAGS